MRRAAARSSALLGALGMLVGTLLVTLSLVSYRPSDPSFLTSAGHSAQNWLGPLGAYVSEFLLLVFGPLVALIIPLVIVVALRLWRDAPLGRWLRSALLIWAAILLIGAAMMLATNASIRGLPLGWGGLLGYGGGSLFEALIGVLGDAGVWARWTLVPLLGAGGLYLWWKGLALEEEERAFIFRREARAPVKISEPEAAKAPKPRKIVAPPPDPEDKRSPVIAEPKSAKQGKARPKQRSLNLDYELPPIELLNPPPDDNGPKLDRSALERNARLLESVLDDFKVKGEVVEVRPGPVVTMYELEPESGIKASRVIQLADDIARNMSAISARVAVIPGRSVIGIELPNSSRQMVVLSEMIGSASFEDQSGKLPIILGKNIAGDPVIADLAPMPHLLVAGTTGSGKSVGLNCMILSLLYRLTPEECKLIMIDPKMLELSIYDDIPHLLSPVVTEPAKAIRALKWAVEQMEDRYRMMASLSVRSLQGFNDKVRAAKATVDAERERLHGELVIDFVTPDWFADYPKACMGGWGSTGLNITPAGDVLPCHAAETIPSLSFANVTKASLSEIWYDDPAFNAFRGTDWMPELCQSCERRDIDFGGCRCQAMAILGDPAATDPVCRKSPNRAAVDALLDDPASDEPFVYRVHV